MFAKKLIRPSTSSLASFFSHNFSSKSKIYKSAAEAVKGIENGSVVGVGGFGICGTPENIIGAVLKQNTKDLTIISNNCGNPFALESLY